MGDLVILNEDEDFVAEQSRKLLMSGAVKLLISGAVYNEEVARPMLGKIFPIVPTKSSLFDENWVGFLSNDGETYYFPKTTVTKVERSKWT